jgi:hypothetical protein
MSDANVTEIRHTIGAQGNLSLRNVSGRVRLIGTDSDEAVVICRAQRGGEPQLNVERSEGGLLVEPERDRGSLRLGFNRTGSFELEAHVPRGARIDVKTVSADIDGRDLVGDQAYKTVSADLRLTAVGGRVGFMTVSGDVRLHETTDVELDGATTSGDLTVEAQLVRRLGVRTVSGDIRLEGRLMPGPRHSVETVSGDLNLEVVGGVTVESRRALDLGRGERAPRIVGDGSARLSFRSMSGDQRIGLRDPDTDDRPAAQDHQPWAWQARSDGPTQDAPGQSPTRLEILQALERGEIDVDEASRRLETTRNG